MRKSALKAIGAVLTTTMVLGSALSAMAASTSSIVKYNGEGTAYTVKTEVAGLTSGENVTYLVHNAENMYSITPSDIDYIDQKAADGTSAVFTYAGTGDFEGKGEKIYVGAKSIGSALQSDYITAEEGITIMINGVIASGLTVDNADTDADTLKTIDLADYVGIPVTGFTINSVETDYINTEDGIAFASDALTEDDVISISYPGALISAADFINSGSYSIETSVPIGNNTGTIASINGLVAAVRRDASPQGEPRDYWYPVEAGILTGELTFPCKALEVDADGDVAYAGGSKIETINFDEGLKAEFIRNIEAGLCDGAHDVSIDLAQITPYGIDIKAGSIETSFEVPVDGKYTIVARTNSYNLDRKPTFHITNAMTEEDVATFAITPAKANAWSVARASETLELEAGTYNVAVSNASPGGPIRFDFAALMPATASTDAAIAGGQEAFVEYAAKSLNYLNFYTEVKLGTVKNITNGLVVFGTVKGIYEEAGIVVDGDAFKALGIGGNGGFAIELEGDDFTGAEVAAYADSYETAPVVVE